MGGGTEEGRKKKAQIRSAEERGRESGERNGNGNAFMEWDQDACFDRDRNRIWNA